MERRLTAILVADVVGFSRLMGKDEAGTLTAVKGLWNELFGPRVTEYHGRIVKLMGDGALVEFSSVVDAVKCAIVAQRDAADRNSESAADKRIEMRIGINLGDVIIEGDDIYGDGVNVAARLEKLAKPGGLALSSTAYEHAAGKIEAEFEDGGEHALKNIEKPIQVYLWSPAIDVENGRDKPKKIEVLPLPEKPSIAVLPFDNMSQDPEQEYFADGLTEDIITELSRFQTFFVIARNSSFFYKGKRVPVPEIGRELGVLYLLEGSVRKVGKRIRITAQLIQAASGNHIWAERYDYDLIDVFEVQDEVTRSIVAALPGRLAEADLNRVKRKHQENLVAYDYMLRGRIHHHHGTEENNAEALRLLDKAIELDPEYSEAYAWQSCTLGQAQARGFGDNQEELFAREVQSAEKGLSLDENNITCQWNMCELQMEWANREYGDLLPPANLIARLERAELHHERAFALNPNDPRIVAQRGELLTWQGKPDEGANWARQAMRLDPYDAGGRAHLLGRALHVAGRYDEAIEAFEQVRKLRYGHHAELAACHAQMGKDKEARLHASEVVRLKPDFSVTEHVESMPFRRDEDREHHTDGLCKAGLPE